MSQVVEVKSGLRQTDVSGWPSTNDVGLEQRKRCSLGYKLYSINVDRVIVQIELMADGS